MSVVRYYLTRPSSGGLANLSAGPVGPWTGSNVIPIHVAPTIPGATSNGFKVGNGGVTDARFRVWGWVTPPLAAAQLVTRVRVVARCEHWLAGTKALAVRVLDIPATIDPSAAQLPGVDVVAYATSGTTTTNGYRLYTIDVVLPAPVTVDAGRRLFVELGGDLLAGGSGQGLYIEAGETGTDLPFTHGLSASNPMGRGWFEVEYADPPVPPVAPSDLVQTGATPTSVDVAWTAPGSGGVPTGYEYRIDGGDPVAVGLVTATTIPGLAPAASYALEVRTIAATGASGWSPVLEVTTAPVPDADRRWWTHRLAAAAGLDPIAAQPVVQVRLWDGAGYVVDDTLSRALQSYQVTYGRRDATSRVEPLTAALVWATPLLTSPPGVATRLQVALSPAFCDAIGLDPVAGIRFTGEVTDPAVAHARRLTSAACAGRLGRGNRMPVDGTAWPVEDDADRVARILPAAGVDLLVGTIDPGSVLVAAPTRLETVGTLLEQTAASSLGQVVEQPSGLVDWHDADHRRDPVVEVTLEAAQVLRDVTWTQRLASLVNDLDVKTADGTVVTITDPESSDPNRYGPWPGSIDTILTNATDAGGLGIDIVGRRADPSWQLPDLTVDLVRTIPIAGLADVLALRHGSLLEVVNLPAEFPNDGRVFVEGHVETATPRTWSLSLSVTDRLQSGVGIRWVDWPDTDDYQWQDLDPDLTWLDLARIYDPADTL